MVMVVSTKGLGLDRRHPATSDLYGWQYLEDNMQTEEQERQKKQEQQAKHWAKQKIRRALARQKQRKEVGRGKR